MAVIALLYIHTSDFIIIYLRLDGLVVKLRSNQPNDRGFKYHLPELA